MLRIGFYQLGDVSVNDALLMLIQKARGKDKKMLVYCPRPAAEVIDDALWNHDPNSWLPHGLDAAQGAELAFVWVCSDMTSNPINADYLMLLHGAAPQSWEDFERVFVVIDGNSDAQLQQARLQWEQWKILPGAELSYFEQVTGTQWKKKA